MTYVVSPASWAQAAGSGESLWAGGWCVHSQQSGGPGTRRPGGSGRWLPLSSPGRPAQLLRVGIEALAWEAGRLHVPAYHGPEWPFCAWAVWE